MSSSRWPTIETLLVVCEAAPREDDEGEAPTSSKGTKWIGRAFFYASLVFGYAMIALGTALSLGLVLNILGYGYQWTDHGLRIDTLEQLRTDNQFQRAVMESMKETRVQ